MPVTPIPFTLRRSTRDPNYVYTVTDMNGLVGMDEDGLVLQYRVKTSQVGGWPVPPPTESDVRVVHIPLDAIRRVELRRGWFSTKLALAAADLRAFEPLHPWLTGGEVALSIPRAERSGAADLASSIELALSTRLLGPGG
jgi:hypothetical protein